MQAQLTVRCNGCGKRLGEVQVDTANLAEEVQDKINKVILAHRQDCKYYRQKGDA